jgi:hypothetical protein
MDMKKVTPPIYRNCSVVKLLCVSKLRVALFMHTKEKSTYGTENVQHRIYVTSCKVT